MESNGIFIIIITLFFANVWQKKARRNRKLLILNNYFYMNLLNAFGTVNIFIERKYKSTNRNSLIHLDSQEIFRT